jgi:hypothetical protein
MQFSVLALGFAIFIASIAAADQFNSTDGFISDYERARGRYYGPNRGEVSIEITTPNGQTVIVQGPFMKMELEQSMLLQRIDSLNPTI